MNTRDKHQSTLIKAMRFPLIVLVVFAHSAGYFNSPTISWSLDGWNVLHFFSVLTCKHLCSIGTCWFFLFAGFLFFLGNEQQDGKIGWKWYLAKWKKRIRSLLIPYLIWNLFAILAIILKINGLSLLGISQSSDESALLKAGPLFWFITGPADFPLWFLRDLILLSLLTPVLQWLFQRIPWISLALLAAFYLIYPKDLPFMSMRGLFFFSAGAWLGIRKAELLSICRYARIPALVLTIILSFVATMRTGYADHSFWLRLFYPFGMITFLNICDRLIARPSRRDRLCRLSASVFFIYAAHEIYILGWTRGLFVRVFGEGLTGSWIKFIFVPFIVLAACLALYYLLKRIMPRAVAVACGGRTERTK